MSVGRAIVCGGRDFDDYVLGCGALFEFAPSFVIEGGARGADRMAREWAIVTGTPFKTVPADWDKYGKRAGHLRNTEMLHYKPDVVIAMPGGRGTANMIAQAHAAGVRVIEVRYRP